VVSASDHNALIIGREDTLHVQGENTMCVEQVQATIPQAAGAAGTPKPVTLTWKSPKPDAMEIAMPLKDAAPGDVTVAIRQYGMPQPDDLTLKSYAEAASIEHLTLAAGDKAATLKGKRLDEVESADLAGISFTPAALYRVQDSDQLSMSATGSTATLKPGEDYSAKVTLRDGRMLHVAATVEAPRPQVELLSKGVQQQQQDGSDASPGNEAPVRLGSPNDLPLQRRLVFFVHSVVPVAFPRTEKIEVAAVDGSFSTTLSLSDGSLILEDTHTAVGVIDPMQRFGVSAFGPLQFRPISAVGVTGDWVPLGTLVRLPGFTGSPTAKELRCPRNLTKPCQLTGSNLFLITEVANNPDMNDAIDVPPDFTGTALTVPNAPRSGANGTLYLRLRDDPQTVQTLNLPIAPAASTAPVVATDGAGTQMAPAAKPDSAAPAPKPEPAPADSGKPTGPNGATPESTSPAAATSDSAAPAPKPGGKADGASTPPPGPTTPNF
jgi:hypothetical protein